MKSSIQHLEQGRYRPIFSVLALLVGSVLLGAAVAPHIFNGFLWLGRHVVAWEGLRDTEFHRVLSRCIMVSALVLAWPILKWGGFTSWSTVGIRNVEAWWKVVGGWWLVGVASMLLVLGLGLLAGAYSCAPGTGGKMVGWLVSFTLIGITVGVIEELFCRGVIYGALRKPMGWVLAALVVSLFYALLHFSKPMAPLETVFANGRSGFELLSYSFAKLGWTPGVIPLLFTLFVIGLVFSVLYERQGHLYGAIGLHAGWVMMMLFSHRLLVRNTDVLPLWFGNETLVSKSYAALVMSVVVLVIILLRPFRKIEYMK